MVLRLSHGYRSRDVVGLFDTGADHGILRMEWKDRLRVADDRCMPATTMGISGVSSSAVYTMVDAELDGQKFRIPSIFSDVVPVDIFGRVGLCDQFLIRLDPIMQTTTFEWKGPQGKPWAEVYERRWEAQRPAAPATKPPPNP